MNKMMRIWLLAALALALFTPQPTQANAGEYVFSVSLGTYDDISDDPGYTVSTATGDFTPQDISLPFTFKYDSVDYTTGHICANGWLEMGQSYTGCFYGNNLASTTVKPILAPLWDDLADDATSEIGYITLGSAPNRIFVVQWKGVLWPTGYDWSRQNFQVRLHETTNVIEFVYGAMTNPPYSSSSASIGINDATGGSGRFLSVTPAAGTADTVSSTTANNDIKSAEYLPSGKTYTFTPPIPAPPGCAINPAPANGATDVPLAANLSWSAGTGSPTGYKLFFGTDTPPTNIVNGTDLGNVTTYDPAADLTAETPYTWQVVPYNANGDATGCPIWSFTSEPTPLNAFPYEESFESGAGGWTSGGTGSTWELGAPADDVIDSASHGSRAWTTGLTANYALNEQSYVRSPGFDFSGLTSPAVLLDVWWESEYAADGAALQYSTDGGVTWTTVGQYTDPQNWYRSNSVYALDWAGNSHGWTGNNDYGSKGWRTAGHSLAALAGQRSVRLRVVFGSDSTGTDDGFAFDRVRIFDATTPPPCATGLGPADGATDVLLNAALKWDGNSSSLVTGYYINFGTDDPPTNLRNHVNLGSVTTYDPPGYMEAMTTHRWQIIPYNSAGEATGCPVWSFTTGSSTTLLDESFDGAAYPSGWGTLPGECTWSWTTAGLTPPQTPHSPRYENRFNSYSCDADEYRQLMAPARDFSAAGDYALRFWLYHDADYPAAPDRMQIQVTLDNGATVADVGAPIPRYAATTGWAQHEVDLSAYAGQSSVRVVFKGISGNGNDMFLDDVQIVHSTAVAAPNCAVLLAPADGATAVLVNADLDWMTGGGAPSGYRIALGTDNPPTDIVANTDLGKVTFYDHPTNLAGETTHYWQVTPYNSYGDAVGCPVWSFTTGATPHSVFPYVEGFEGGAAGWTSGGANSSWELGTPAGDVIQGAAAGSNAWMTGLSAKYANDEQSYVQSPAFDLSGLAHPYVKFDLWWDSEGGADGAQLQASLDGGQTWATVGYGAAGLNWYNATVDGLPGLTNDGWSGAAAEDLISGLHQAGHGWRTALYSLEDYAGAGHGLLRFFFGTDDANTYDGFAFDNFEIRAGCAWTGAASDDWHTAGNWDCGHVPGADEIVTIPAVAPHDPVIRAAAAAWAVGLDAIWGNGRTLTLEGGSLTVGDTLINHSVLSQTQPVNGAPVAFFDTGGYGGLTLDPGAQDLGATTVQIRGDQDCTAVPGETIRRCFDVTPGNAPGSGVALTFYFSAADLPAGQSCETVEVYHWDGAWSDALARDMTYGTDGRQCATEPYSIRVTGVTSFSPFVLRSGGKPTVVALRGFAARGGLWGGAALAVTLACGIVLARRRKYHAHLTGGVHLRLHRHRH
ncbi:MAG TPA: hypothetical protein PLJ78_08035 [Anaerolineae bacterium]|nr:hypothetical protein [Anaerolineae bacterium]HQK13874.1 hypothetical protein [Anaerolineae bacterium]